MSKDEQRAEVAERAGETRAGPAAARPVVEPDLTRWGAFRDARLEAKFVDERYRREMAGPMRWSAWSVVLIYASFGVVDLVVVYDVVHVAWVLRYGVVVPIALALALVTMTRHASRYHRAIGVVHSVLGPALFLTVGELASDPGGQLYTVWGAILFPLLVPHLTRLSTKQTLGVSAFTLCYLVALDWAFTPRQVWQQLFIVLFFLTGCGYSVWMAYTLERSSRRNYWNERIIEWQMGELTAAREKSERLLLNVLPASIAARLRDGDQTIADSFAEVTVLFADIAGFTQYSAKVTPEELVSRLDDIFSAFDDIAGALELEKIKTIGDAYMVAAGLPEAHADGPAAVARMALQMLDAIEQINQESGERFAVRIGVHTGPAVAGVIGRRKFIYDLWGDTVNTASRMESHGEVGKIQISEQTATLLDGRFDVVERGLVTLKGKGELKTFWLRGGPD